MYLERGKENGIKKVKMWVNVNNVMLYIVKNI